MINTEPRFIEAALLSNINIVTSDIKNARADHDTLDQPTIIQEASPKLPYNAHQYKKYYKKEIRLFDSLTKGAGLPKGNTKAHEDKTSNLPNSTVARPIKEWFKLFLQIVNDDQMIGKLQRSLKATIPKEESKWGTISAKFP